MRSGAVVIGIGTVALVLAACASSPSSSTSTAPPVQVIASADDSVSRMVNTANIKEATKEALRAYAANAGEATVTISFTSFGVVRGVMPEVAVMTHSTPGYAVPIVSAQPSQEFSQPLVGGRSTTRIAAPQSLVNGTYTITGANGTLLERRSIAILPDYRNGRTFRVRAHHERGRDVAKRVAALTIR
jgi:hypothetical protein